MKRSVQFNCWVASHVGNRRRNQEDAVAACGLNELRPKAWQATKHDRSWAFIADGMGGHAGGEVASDLAVTMLSERAEELQTEMAITSALLSAHNEIYSRGSTNDNLVGMATTISGVIFNGDNCLAFNLGDSRIYHLGGDGLQQITVDHDSGEGLFGYLGGTYSSLARKPDFHRITCRLGEIVILCTDGLTKMLSDLEIEAVLAEHVNQPAKALVDAALEAGGYDNVSVIVVRLETESGS